MSVPDHKHVVQAVFNAGHYDLHDQHDRDRFVDDAVRALHATDRRWGFLRKRGGTQVHGHSEDGALYLSDVPGQSQHVDFGGGFGGPTPSIAWSVDIPRYSREDWIDPDDHDRIATPTPPAPVVQPYPGDGYFVEAIGVPLEADYALAGQRLNAGSTTWSARTIWRHVHEGMTMEQSVAQSRKEWRAALGLPPTP